MSLEVLDASGLATIQDSGRKGWRRFGVPISGPMDIFAFCAANLLAGNPASFAVLEIGLGELTFRALQDCIIAVAGSGYHLSIYLWDFPLWSSFFVRGGWAIHFNKSHDGMWAYLAIAGGVQGRPVIGSQSTCLRGAFGGLEGRRLQAGDRILGGKPSRPLSHLAARTLPVEARPAYRVHPVIDIILGPQTKHFGDESLRTLLSSEYTVSLTSDRMGYRLAGPPLTQRDKTELISEGMTFGAMQVPADGQPIVTMADGPTTGGYPKIGAVASADLPVLAQCMPDKSRIRFRATTVAEAQQKYRTLMNGLENRILNPEYGEW
ncbi:MAG TPA: biotin-dependent carboxyltransferase family protein [Anaerolineales bacterium]|nr:biotin-dependent carboxyltransferase family protein [Anaerolineales bacterium]